MRIAPSSPASKPSAPRAGGRAAPPARSFIAVLDERVGIAPEAATPGAAKPAVTPPPPPAAPPSPMRAMLERAVGNEKQIDALLDAAARGKTFKPGELLALQATVARYSQTVEVVSRVADRLVGAVKQTMGTQV
jgi:hypothetical protein